MKVFTMSELVHQKKALIKRRESNPSLEMAINAELDLIEQKIMSRVNKSDQNFLRVFYKTAKEHLPSHVFAKIEGVASTRRHQHQSSNQKGNQ